MRKYSLLFGLLGVLLFLLSLPQGCSSPEECDNSKNGGVSLTTLNPNGSPCTKNCDCNNQNYTGVCEPSGNQCKSQERGVCSVKGEATPCVHRTQCKDAIKICMPSYLGDRYWGDCMCPPYHCAKEGDCPNGMSCNGTTCVKDSVEQTLEPQSEPVAEFSAEPLAEKVPEEQTTDAGSETVPEQGPDNPPEKSNINLNGYLLVINTDIYSTKQSTDSAITVWNLKNGTKTKTILDGIYESSSTMLARHVKDKIYLLVSYHNDNQADKITILDLQNLTTTTSIKLENNAWPSDLVVVGKKAYVTCYTKPYIQIVDLETNSLGKTIDISKLTEDSTSKARCSSADKCLTYSGRKATCEGTGLNKNCKDPAPEAVTLRASDDGNSLYVLTQGLPPYVDNILNINALNPITNSQPKLGIVDITPQASTENTITKIIELSNKYPTNLISYTNNQFFVVMHGSPIDNNDDSIDVFNSTTNTITGPFYNNTTLTASLSPVIDNITVDKGKNKAFAAVITFDKDKPWELTGESTVREFQLNKNAPSKPVGVLGKSEYAQALVVQSKYLFAADRKTDEIVVVALDKDSIVERLTTTKASDFLSPMQVLFIPSAP